MKPRILVIYMGGTVGMKLSAWGYAPEENLQQLLNKKLLPGDEHLLPDYQLLECDDLIDSANLKPSDWTHIAKLIIDNWDSYSGFVVLHGTDTMAYSASAMSYIFRASPKPIIFTGSQLPLREFRSDAMHNVTTSLMLAAEHPITEVCIYFNGQLLRGNRSVKLSASSFDAFDSPNFPALGKVGTDIHIEKDLLLKSEERAAYSIPQFTDDAVAIAHLYPGMNAQWLKSSINGGKMKGLIILSYGAGNPPDNNDILMWALETAQQKDIITLNVTQCTYGSVEQGIYASGATLNRIGVIGGGDITLEAAYSKLHYLIAMGGPTDTMRQKLMHALCGEKTDKN